MVNLGKFWKMLIYDCSEQLQCGALISLFSDKVEPILVEFSQYMMGNCPATGRQVLSYVSFTKIFLDIPY